MFLSKEILLYAVHQLAELDGGNYKQGLTQKVSAIRYFFAMVAMAKECGVSELDTAIIDQKKKFEQKVSDIVNVLPGYYTGDFITLKDDDGGCCTSSNFFSAGVVSRSITSEKTFNYPAKRFSPLLRIKKGVVSVEDSAYINIEKYFPTNDIKIAFFLWLARKVLHFSNDLIYEQLLEYISSIYSDDIVNALSFTKGQFKSFIEKSTVSSVLRDYLTEFTADDFVKKCEEEAKPSSEIQVEKMSLEELGNAFWKEYSAATERNDGSVLGILYNSVLKYGDSLFNDNGDAIYTARTVVAAIRNNNPIFPESYETEISKAFKLQKMIRNRSEEHLFLRRILGAKKQEQFPKDTLTIALKLFEEGRKHIVRAESSYDDLVARARVLYSEITGDFLATCDYKAFRSGLSDKQVANSIFVKHTEADKRALGDFLEDVRKSPKAFSEYLKEMALNLEEDEPNDAGNANGAVRKIPGVGPVMLTNFLMRSRPDIFCTYSKQMFNGMKSLGLLSSNSLPELSADSYESFKAVQTRIRDRMREMNVCQEDGSLPADYWTVNEFTWWLDDEKNKNLVKELVMNTTWQEVKPSKRVDVETRTLKDALAGDDMLTRLTAALRTKPFAILAGHSGTGKSRLVRRLAYMTCNDVELFKEAEGHSAPGNYCMVQVKPNWHDSTDLFGYYSEIAHKYHTTPVVEFICKAYAYPETPFFLCLDEMNLAPVEQYFAEYLSAIESMEKKGDDWVTDSLVAIPSKKDEDGKDVRDLIAVDQLMGGQASQRAGKWIKDHGLTIPANLFVVGTVNMDETTHQFSRKVLDRAMTLLMDEIDFTKMSEKKKPSDEILLEPDGIKFFLEKEESASLDKDEMMMLQQVNNTLANTPFVVGYRFANEYALYRDAIGKLDEDDNTEVRNRKALDHIVLMKLLPRIHGEAGEVKLLFGKDDSEGLRKLLDKDTLSGKKMKEILDRKSEYLTFWP